MKAQNPPRKEERDHAQRKESDRENDREIHLRLRLRNLFLRLPEGLVPLPGEQLPVRLPSTCQVKVICSLKGVLSEDPFKPGNVLNAKEHHPTSAAR
jgi:hypothetical protein